MIFGWLPLLLGCDALRVDFGTAPETGRTRMHAEPEALDLVAFVGVPQVVPITVVHDGGPASSLSATVDAPWSVAIPGTLDVGGSVEATLSLSPTEVGEHAATLTIVGNRATVVVAITTWVQMDADGDGHGAVDSGGDDCDDTDDDVFPGAEDLWYDGVDSDCAGDDDFDADHDGAPLSSDCDDADPAVGVGAAEAWNGVDDDCDGAVDELDLVDLAPWVEGDAADLYVGAAYGVRAVDTAGGANTWIVVKEEAEVWVLAGAPTTTDLSDNTLVRLSRYDQQITAVSDDVGDPDGDGVPDLLVTTAYGDETYTTTWLVPAVPPAEDRDLGAVFSAAFYASELEEQAWTGVLEDVDGDGLDDVAIGAPREDDYWFGGDDEEDGRALGAVALWIAPVSGFHGIGGESQSEYVAGDEEDHHLGMRLAAGDVDGDGYGDLLVGEPGNDDGADDGGAMHLILGAATPNWKSGIGRTATLSIVGDNAGAELGDTAPPAPADLDGDGSLDIVLPVPGLGRVAVVTTGSAGVVALSDVPIAWSGTGAAGSAVCISEHAGEPSLLVGAPDAAGDAGELWALHLGGGVLTPAGPITGSSGAHFGSGCTSGADVDADGVPDVLVGAMEWSGRAGDGGLLVRLPSE